MLINSIKSQLNENPINIKVVPAKSNKLTLDDLDEIRMEVLHDMNLQLNDLEDEMAEKQRLKEKTPSSWSLNGAPIYMPRSPNYPSLVIPNKNKVFNADFKNKVSYKHSSNIIGPKVTKPAGISFRELEKQLKEADQVIEELKKLNKEEQSENKSEESSLGEDNKDTSSDEDKENTFKKIENENNSEPFESNFMNPQGYKNLLKINFDDEVPAIQDKEDKEDKTNISYEKALKQLLFNDDKKNSTVTVIKKLEIQMDNPIRNMSKVKTAITNDSKINKTFSFEIPKTNQTSHFLLPNIKNSNVTNYNVITNDNQFWNKKIAEILPKLIFNLTKSDNNFYLKNNNTLVIKDEVKNNSKLSSMNIPPQNNTEIRNPINPIKPAITEIKLTPKNSNIISTTNKEDKLNSNDFIPLNPITAENPPNNNNNNLPQLLPQTFNRINLNKSKNTKNKPIQKINTDNDNTPINLPFGFYFKKNAKRIKIPKNGPVEGVDTIFTEQSSVIKSDYSNNIFNSLKKINRYNRPKRRIENYNPSPEISGELDTNFLEVNKNDEILESIKMRQKNILNKNRNLNLRVQKMLKSSSVLQ